MASDPRSGSRPSPRRRALWIALGLLALVAVAWGALAVLFPPARVRALVEAQLSRTLAREVSFEGASVSLWPPVRLRVRDLKLAEPGGLAQGAAFEARALDVDLDVLGLLARRLVVRRLAVGQPRLHLALLPGGRTNFDGVMRAEPPPGAGEPGAGGKAGAAAAPFDLAVSDLSIVEAQVLVDDHVARRRVAFGLDSKLGFSLERGGTRIATEGSTVARGLAFGPLSAARLSDLNRALAKIEWRIEHRGKYDAESKRLALERLALGSGKAEVALSGVVNEVPGRSQVDFRARGAGVDLGQLLEALAAADAAALHGIRGAGRLDFDLAIRGPVALGGSADPGASQRTGVDGAPGPAGAQRLPEVTGRIAIADGSFRYPGAPAGVEALAFTALLAPDSLAIGDLAARVSGQPVSAAIAVTRFADPLVRFAVKGDVDLAAVSPLVAPKGAKLGGRAALDLRGRGRAADPQAMALEGVARLTGVSIESPALPKRIDQANGEISFSAARAEVRGLAVLAGQSSYTLDATVTRPLALTALPGAGANGPGGSKEGGAPPQAGAQASAGRVIEPAGVDFTLRSPHLDLEELLPVTPAGAPFLPNARGGGRVEIARLKNKRLDVANVTARLVLSPGVVEVPEYGFDGYGGAVRGSGRFDLRDPARPVYTVKAKVDSVEADRLLSAWTPARGLLHGALNTTLDLSGEGSSPDDLKRSLTAVGLAALANGTLGPGPVFEALAGLTNVREFKQVRFQDLRLPFRVERGRVITDPVFLTGSNGDWRLSGGVGFDGSLDYAVSTTIPAEAVKKLGADAALAAGALADEKGRILLDLRVTGSARSPRVDWDRKAMGDRARGRISDAFEKQRSRIEDELIRSLAPREKPAGGAGDSAAAPLDETARRRALQDSLKKAARGLLEGFLGRGKSDTTRR